MWCSSIDESQVISKNDFFDLMPSFWSDMPAGTPDLNHIHAVHLKGPRLDSSRLRKALNELQARHERLRARLHMDMWGKGYLLRDETPIPLYEIDGNDHNCCSEKHEIIGYEGKLSKAALENWKQIEEPRTLCALRDLVPAVS
eukprot:Skav208470  [mRNA]  locus=scaffold1104:282262:284024:+ [translate_table: standard]